MIHVRSPGHVPMLVDTTSRCTYMKWKHAVMSSSLLAVRRVFVFVLVLVLLLSSLRPARQSTRVGIWARTGPNHEQNRGAYVHVCHKYSSSSYVFDLRGWCGFYTSSNCCRLFVFTGHDPPLAVEQWVRKNSKFSSRSDPKTQP